MSDTEILSDDDVPVVVDQIIDLDKIERSKSKSKQIETIVIDDEKHSQSDNNNVTNTGNNITLDMNSIYRENKLMGEFIEKCINLEYTGGMLRIINRTLLRVYKETDKNYKNSSEFEKVLQRYVNLIETEPHRKYSHMKNVIEALKSGGVKKRVKLTTLATNIKNKRKNMFADFENRKVKRKKYEIIDLDSETNDVIPVINLDEDPNDVIVLDEPAKTRVNEEKENMQISAANQGDVNQTADQDHKNSQNDSKENSYLKPQLEVFVPNNLTKQQAVTEPVRRHQNDVIVLDELKRTRKDEEEHMHDRDLKEISDNHHVSEYECKNSQNDSEEYGYLTPQIEVFVPNNVTEQESMGANPVQRHMEHSGQMDCPISIENSSEEEEQSRVQQEIRKIESQIENCKVILQQLDETEVINDNLSSPYILSEKIKTKIVALYKTLCELTGSESVKKRTVRLQVQDGHPAGPVRRLEEFINTNIGEDGDPQFPDFRDVTMCVLQANEADGLGWSKGQILKVAVKRKRLTQEAVPHFDMLWIRQRLNKDNITEQDEPRVSTRASSLFTQCGKALQKRRQKREWRDLLATVKSDTLDYDPADGDPILQEKLEQNRRIALCKEHELLDRYSKMQDTNTQAKLNKMNALRPVTHNGVGVIDSCENVNVQNNIIMEVPIVNNENDDAIAKNAQHEAEDCNYDLNTVQKSLVIFQTEVAVEFEGPENVEITDESKESLHTNYIPCSQRILMDKENSIANDANEPNVKIKTEIDMEVRGNKNNIDTACVDNDNILNCELATSSKNKLYNLDSAATTNSHSTVNRNEENSQEDISEKQYETDLKSGAGGSENEETNHLDKVKIKKEPVDIAALLDGLGDNFSADIVDIEDPFLVIEISDSSDEEEYN